MRLLRCNLALNQNGAKPRQPMLRAQKFSFGASEHISAKFTIGMVIENIIAQQTAFD
jgi:hypothetical protein